MLCYLNEKDLPNKIISHGVLLDANKKKLRWRDDKADNYLPQNISPKILRAHFLRRNVSRDIVINQENINSQLNDITKIYVKMKRVLEPRNFSQSEQGLEQQLLEEYQKFNSEMRSFNLQNSFNCMNRYINKSWKIVKNRKLSKDEYRIVDNFKKIYFGD